MNGQKLTEFWNRLFGSQFNDRRRVHCVGDSHLDIFNSLAIKSDSYSPDIEFCLVRGATNLGLANPRSKTNAGKIFRKYLKSKVKYNDAVILCLGEVDCGFVIWYQAQKKSLPIRVLFQKSLDNYKALIKLAIQKAGHAFVLSVPLPTIMDGQDWGEVANARKEVTSTLVERTELTKTYNVKLSELCDEEGAGFVDLQRDTLNRSTGLVDERFLNSDPLDHHLSIPILTPILAQRIHEHCPFDVENSN